jgi:cytochrome c oxidase subunit 2
MIQFLTLVTIVLGVMMIARLVRVYELSAELKGVREEVVNESDTRFNAGMMLVFVIAFFAFFLWQFMSWKDLLLPIPAAEHGKEIDWLFNFNMVIITIVFAITHVILFYFGYKYYFRKGNKATFFAHSNKLEMVWTIIPAIVLSVIIIYGLRTWNRIMTPGDPAKSIVIELYSKQFDWTARYAGADNRLGATNYKLIDDTNPLALVQTDNSSNDDILVKGEFHIPVGIPVIFKMRSRDVIHSAFMPHFRAQMNAVPGMETQFTFVPTVSTAEMRKIMKNEEYNYILLCNKICGAAHNNMQMNIIVESEADYKKWLSEQKTFGASVAKAEPAKTEVKADSTAVVPADSTKLAVK